ncbi:MAG: AAA family ATPase [Burkholderiaceae bacterium]|nr:AAA family ATPase [Burkholderiaceae bacterium]
MDLRTPDTQASTDLLAGYPFLQPKAPQPTHDDEARHDTLDVLLDALDEWREAITAAKSAVRQVQQKREIVEDDLREARTWSSTDDAPSLNWAPLPAIKADELQALATASDRDGWRAARMRDFTMADDNVAIQAVEAATEHLRAVVAECERLAADVRAKRGEAQAYATAVGARVREAMGADHDRMRAVERAQEAVDRAQDRLTHTRHLAGRSGLTDDPREIALRAAAGRALAARQAAVEAAQVRVDEAWDAQARADGYESMKHAEKVMAATLKVIEGGAAAPSARLQIVPAAEFARGDGVGWSVKHVLPRSGLAVIYGAPGSGKSFFALDLVAAIGRGVAWRGRKVRKGRAVYVAAEGAGGFRARMKAYTTEHGIEGLELGVVADAPNFFTGAGDARLLAARVQEWGGADVVVVDTLAASSAGADENTGKDMNAIIGRMAELQAATGALVVLIHHSGKDESKGARGWSGLKAAVDTEIEVSRPNEDDPIRVARVTKQKDGESGAVFPFSLRAVGLGADADGEPITSCVVETADEVPVKRARPTAAAAERRPRGQYQQVAHTLIAAGGAVAFDEVLDAIVAKMPPPEGKRDQRAKNARAEIEKLIRGGFIETTEGGRLLRPAGAGELL